MKKHISLILTGLLIAVVIHAQNPETLTNSSVVKMSKANLSDELITDMIQNSPVKFDLSVSAIKNLEGEGVTAVVIQSMKSAAAKKTETGRPAPATEKKVIQAPDKSESVAMEPSAYESSKETETVSLVALNYVGPLTELIKFNESKFNGLEITLSEWDNKVRGYVADINKVKDQMLQVENELRMMKNSDTKSFDGDILSLKGKLDAYRKNYTQTKEIMIKGGATIVKNLETMSSVAARDISKAYSEASKQLGSANANPASGENATTMNYTKREVNGSCVSYIVYLNEMLAWHQNEMKALHDVINEWNPRVIEKISTDEQLRSQMEPIEKRLQELSSNQKQNKAEISTLKKQVSEIEKSRKKLADQMKDDAKDLASYIKQMSQKNQASLKERYTDIIENITYSFEEKLSM